MSKKKSLIVVGTRGSKLALAQTEEILKKLRTHFPDITFEIKKIVTSGDKKISGSLVTKIKESFTKEIEEELLKGKIDLAIHSMKDLSVTLPRGLVIPVVPKRENPQDVLISRDNLPLNKLPPQSRIGTSSIRRKAQIKYLRNDLRLVDLRGNLNTRLRKLERGLVDAIVVAAAGIKRMGWVEKITEYFPYEQILPAPGQGAIGIEIRKDRSDLLEILGILNDADTFEIIKAEREVLRILNGGCQIPIGVLGEIKENLLVLKGRILTPDGKQKIEAELIGPKGSSVSLAKKLVDKLTQMGAEKLLKENDYHS